MRTAVLTANISHPLSIKLRQLLAAGLDSQGPTLAQFEQAESLLSRFRPQALVVVLTPNPDRALQTLTKVRGQVSGPILAVGPTSDPKLILQALHEGVTHYLDEDDLAKQFEAVVPRLQGHETRAIKVSGQAISVLSASGGSGASTLAVNLAAVLAMENNRCALVDLKPGVGDLAALLDLKPTHTLADLCSNPSRVDQAMLETAMAVHSSGVSLLAPPLQYDDIRLITPQGVHKVLSLAREAFPFVVVDQEDCFHEEQVMALRQADVILLVARLDFCSLRNTRRILDYLGQTGITKERVQLVINRHGQAKELPAEEVQEALEIKRTHLIPDDPGAVNGANNTGVPVVVKAPSSKAALAIVRLAKTLAPSTAPASAAISPSKSTIMRWLAPFH